MAKAESIFKDFTNLYPVTKTLRFELKPVEGTQGLEDIIERDKERDEKYKDLKKIWDEAHRDFIRKSLDPKKVSLKIKNLEKYQELHAEVTSDSFKVNGQESTWNDLFEIKKEIENEVNDYMEEYTSLCKPADKIKNNLISAGIKIDESKFSESDVMDIVKSFDKFSGYLGEYCTSRKNLYKSPKGSGEGVTISRRIINKNLPIFVDNIKTVNDFIKKNYPKKELEMDTYFSLKKYHTFLLQEEIDNYNDYIGNLRKSMKVYKDKEKIDINLPRKLDKQILGQSRNKKENSKPIEKDEEVIGRVEELKYVVKKFKNNLDKAITTISQSHDTNNNFENIWLSSESVEGPIANLFGKNEFLEILTNIKVNGKQLAKEKDNRIKIDDKNHPFIEFSELSKIIESQNKSLPEMLKQNLDEIKKDLEKYENELPSEYNKDNKESIEKIKDYAGASMQLWRMAKWFVLEKKGEIVERNRNSIFYDYIEEVWDKQIVNIYNDLRNHITKKPYSQDKINLTFDNGNLLGGWDENRENESMGVLLKNNENFYLGILDKEKGKNLFRKLKKGEKTLTERTEGAYDIGSNRSDWQKAEIKSLSNINMRWLNKKNFYPDDPSKKRLITEEIVSLEDKQNKTKEDEKNIVEAYKKALPEYSHAKWITSLKGYKDIMKISHADKKKFCADLEKITYRLQYVPLANGYVEKAVEDGKLYLFKIHSKDFNDKKSNGKKITEDLQTLYFRKILEEQEGSDVLFRLQGSARIFHRKKSLETKEKSKRNENGKTFEVIEKERYTEDKNFLHITATFYTGKLYEGKEKFNKYLNEVIFSQYNDVNIIGIDRGENHLLYYSVIDKDCNILEQNTLNIINGVDYWNLLNTKEVERQKQRQSWQEIEQIKDSKKGYLSLVVREIVDLALRHNAVIVLENLNIGFKQFRQKVEKNVYQQFESHLISKLNYLVFKPNSKKELPKGLNTGVEHALQLTPDFTELKSKEITGQVGIVFFVSPSWTSVTDPETGFFKDIKLKNKKDDIHNFFIGSPVTVEYDKDRKSFLFKFNDDSKRKWEINSFVNERWLWNQKKRENEMVLVNDKLKELFERNKIDYENNINISNIIKNKKDYLTLEGFYKELNYFFKILLLIRNKRQVKKGEYPTDDDDFILSPVNPFFDSRENNKNMPKNSDANGAYNIARKGLIALNELKKNGKFTNVKKNEWVKFLEKNKK